MNTKSYEKLSAKDCTTTTAISLISVAFVAGVVAVKLSKVILIFRKLVRRIQRGRYDHRLF
jgi:hypothetical protein